jgi:hypothetical protein
MASFFIQTSIDSFSYTFPMTCECIQRKHLVGCVQLDGFLVHTEYHAGLFILSYRMDSSFFFFQQTLCTVIAHSGQEDRDCIFAGNPGRRPEKHVHQGYRRAIVQFPVAPGSASLQEELPLAGCDPGKARITKFKFSASLTSAYASSGILAQSNPLSEGLPSK